LLTSRGLAGAGSLNAHDSWKKFVGKLAPRGGVRNGQFAGVLSEHVAGRIWNQDQFGTAKLVEVQSSAPPLANSFEDWRNLPRIRDRWSVMIRTIQSYARIPRERKIILQSMV
jgi:hypothetical protein